MKRLSLKYIAGLIDGEGCIDFQPQFGRYGSKRYSWITPRLRVTLADSCREVLDALHSEYGGSLSRRESNNPNWQNSVTWQTQGRKARKILQQVAKHMILKQQQAYLCIWWIDHMMGHRIDSKPTMEAIRKAAQAELKAMKRDPQRLSERAVADFQKKFEAEGSEAEAIVQAASSR